MSPSAPPHETCAVFNELQIPTDGAIHRFIVGQESEPVALDPQSAANELGDAFAQLLLLKGNFPANAGEVLEALDAATSEDDPLRVTQFFLVGENSQIPADSGVRDSVRFLIARGSGPLGPDMLLSAFHPDESDVEVMAWDNARGGFNYYRTVGSGRGWVFAGNSRHALSEPTEGKGPFESHKSGAFLMKELRAPWINWHSPDAPVVATTFPAGDERSRHPWFTDKVPLGAFQCEKTVARPSMIRWARARFDELASATTVENPARVMRQVLETPMINLVSSKTESANAANVEAVDLPQTFFVDSEALTEILGLPAPPPLQVPSAIYRQSLETFQVTLTDNGNFSRSGDTHFAFCVPERAFEDQQAIVESLRIGLCTDRLVAALLMTDFANPVFSTRRAALMAHVPASASLSGGSSGFSEEFANAIVAAADSTSEGSPEREFAQRWAVGDAWREELGRLLSDYYQALTTRLASQEGYDDFVLLAESRRALVGEMPIKESALLFANTNASSGRREMRPDASVVEV